MCMCGHARACSRGHVPAEVGREGGAPYYQGG